MCDSLIKFNNVTFTYNSDDTVKPALKNLSFEVKKGEFLAVLGHNGSGKSTAAKMMNALLVPDSGEVTVYGMNTSDESKTLDIRKKVGMVFQNPD
ncbi:MAG: ATP-binding cassette domain-containing protein, partial [Clostridia bacterium]|nr:ATP-binding cassette domain-containing protein [Clostridia bacterium]